MTARIDLSSSRTETTSPLYENSCCPARIRQPDSSSTMTTMQVEVNRSCCCSVWSCIKRVCKAIFQFFGCECCFAEDTPAAPTQTETAAASSESAASLDLTPIEPLVTRSQNPIRDFVNSATMPLYKAAIIFRENNRSIFFYLREIQAGTFPAFQQEAMQNFRLAFRNQTPPDMNQIGITIILSENRITGDESTIIWCDRRTSAPIHSGSTRVIYGECLCVACQDDNVANRTQIRAFFENAFND